MSPLDLPKWLWTLVVALAAYWLWVGWNKVEAKRRERRFQLDQRRKAGIPDSDRRPFKIAHAEALERKRQQDIARVTNSASQPDLGSVRRRGTGTAGAPLSASALPTQPSFRSSVDLPSYQSGYLDNASGHLAASSGYGQLPPQFPRAHPSQRGGLLLPSPSSTVIAAAPDNDVYNPAYAPASSLRTSSSGVIRGGRARSAQAKARLYASTCNDTRSRKRSDRSEAGSDVGGRLMLDASDDMQGQRRKARRTARGADDDAVMWEEGAEADYGRTGRKRKQSEARDGAEDSVAGRRHPSKKTRAQSIYEDDDERSLMELVSDDETPAPDDAPRVTKRGADQLDEDDGQELYEPEVEREIPVRRGSRKRGKKAHSTMPAPAGVDRDTEMAAGDEKQGDQTSSPGKRKADTSEDREVGEEWNSHNGMRWRHCEDGVSRRLATVREMRPKYNMPKDSKHPDANVMIPVYVEKFLSEAEFEEARRNKLLSHQEVEREREEEEKRKKAEGEAAKAAEGRDISTPKKLQNTDLLYSSPGSGTPLRVGRKPSDLSNLFVRGSSPMRSTPDRASTPELSSSVLGRSIGANGGRRIALANASPAPGSPARTMPLGSRRTSLDEESKRRREEALMKKLREDKERREKEEREKERKRTGASPAPAQAGGSSAATASVSVGGGLGSLFAPKPVGGSTPSPAPAPASAAASTTAPASSGGFFSGLPGSQSGTAPSAAKASDKEPAPSAASTGGFSFSGLPGSSGVNNAPSAGGNENKVSPAPFTFGAPKTEAPKPAPASAAPAAAGTTGSGFSFGPPTAAPNSNSAPPAGPAPFSFGAPKPAGSAAPGLPAPAASASAASASSALPFSFGALPANKPESKPAPGGSTFSFGAPPTSQLTVNGGATLGSAPQPSGAATIAAPTFNFGGPASSSNAGNTNTGSAPAPAAPFSFGAPSSASSSGGTGTGAPKLGVPSFSFGVPSSSAAASNQAAKPAAPFTFGAPSSSASAPASGSAGTGSAPAPFTFGAPPPSGGAGQGQQPTPPTQQPAFNFSFGKK